MLIFFALIITLGIWSADNTGPHHPTYVEDRSWYEKELHVEDQNFKDSSYALRY